MTTTTHDAIGMLKADHQQVQALFAEFEALSDRSKVSKKKLADQICAALRLHTQLEEQMFYPAVREAVDDEDLMDEALVEHAAAKQLITQIAAMDPDDALYDAKVTVLSEQITHHIDEEEGEIFPKVKRGGVDLQALGEQMSALKRHLRASA